MNYKETQMWKEINQVPEVFSAMYEANEKVMQTLVATIKNSNVTNFVTAARGASEDAVVFFKYMLEIYTNYTVSLSAPSVITLYKGKIDYSNSIVLGCSASGMAEDVLEVIKKGNDQNAITVAVTNNPNSPIAKEAKFVLLCKAGEENGVVAIKTYHSEMYLLLWLASELANSKYNVLSLKNLNKEILHVLPELDQLSTKYAEKYKDMKGGFVLARGLSYAVALETALLIQETCYLDVKGYAGSNFLHGRTTLVSQATPVLMFCAENRGDEELRTMIRADQIKTIEKVLGLGAPILLVTNDCVLTGKFSKCDEALINFSAPEEITIFAFTLFGQMLACKLSCLIGNDPDAPRSLERTIITK